MTGDYKTSLSLKCQSLHLLNLFPSVFGVLRAQEVQPKERQLGSTDLFLNRLQIIISLKKK